MSMSKTTSMLLLLAALAVAFLALPELPRRASVRSEPAQSQYLVPGDFLVDLRDGHAALFGVGMVLDHVQADAVARRGAGAELTTLLDGAEATPREMRLRAVITEVVAAHRLRDLRGARKRSSVETDVQCALARATGLRPATIYFTDLALR